MYEWRVWRILSPTFPFLLPSIFPDPPFLLFFKGWLPSIQQPTYKNKMENTKKEETFTATAGVGTRSGRHLGGVDPAPLGSSSIQGPTTGLTTGPVENVATAATLDEKEKVGCLSVRLERIDAEASNTPLPQRERRKSRGSAQPETTMSWVQMAAEDEAMDVETTSGRSLQRALSQESISSRQSMQTVKLGTDDDLDSSGNEARSTISVASGASMRNIVKASKRKRSVTSTQTGKKPKENVASIVDSDEEEKNSTSSRRSSQAVPAGLEDSLKAKSFDELAQTAYTWLQDIDFSRRKCANMKGPIHKVFKDRTLWLEELIRCLVDKGTSTGDPVLYKMKLREITGKLKAKEQEENKWKEEKRNLEREVEILYKKVEEMESAIHQLSRGQQPDPEALRRDSEYYLTTYPAYRPALKGEKKLLTTDASKVILPSLANLPATGADPGPGPSGLGLGRGVRAASGPGVGPDPVSGPSRPGRPGPGPGPAPGDGLGPRMDPTRLPKTEKKELISKEDEEVENIKQQIKQLSLRKKEIYRTKKNKEENQEGRQKEGPSKIKVLSNIQVVPPRKPDPGRKKDTGEIEGNRGKTGPGEEWTVVNSKGKKGKKKGAGGGKETNVPFNKKDSTLPKLRRIPKTAAVSLRGKGEHVSYADILRKARSNISLKELGIETSKIKKGIDGSVIIEIPGPEGKDKATTLASELKQVLSDNEVQVSCPVIKAEMRIYGFDDSVTTEEIRSTIAEQTTCESADIRVGTIRWMRNGLGTVWLQCPAQAANHIAREGKIRMGWTVARAEMLQKRPLQCYRCWGLGHVRFSCTADVDRSAVCYHCGVEGHFARNCSSTLPSCLICKERNLPAQHRVGTNKCSVEQRTLKSKPLPRIKPASDKTPVRRPESEMEIDNAA